MNRGRKIIAEKGAAERNRSADDTSAVLYSRFLTPCGGGVADDLNQQHAYDGNHDAGCRKQQREQVSAS